MGCMMASARCRGLLLACLLLACLLLAPFAAEAQQVKLRLTSQLPSSHYAGINLAQFKEEVERRSEKTLIIEIFDDGRLYKDDGAMGAVSSGAVDMGFVTGDRFAEKIAAVSIFQQPFLFNFEALVRAAISPDHEIRRLIDKAILEFNRHTCPLVVALRVHGDLVQGTTRDRPRGNKQAEDTCPGPVDGGFRRAVRGHPGDR